MIFATQQKFEKFNGNKKSREPNIFPEQHVQNYLQESKYKPSREFTYIIFLADRIPLGDK